MSQEELGLQTLEDILRRMTYLCRNVNDDEKEDEDKISNDDENHTNDNIYSLLALFTARRK